MGRRAERQRVEPSDRQMASSQADRRVDRVRNGTRPIRESFTGRPSRAEPVSLIEQMVPGAFLGLSFPTLTCFCRFVRLVNEQEAAADNSDVSVKASSGLMKDCSAADGGRSNRSD